MTLKLAFESGSEILYVDIRESVALEKTAKPPEGRTENCEVHRFTFWWYLRSGPTRSHSEHGSETLQLQW